METTSYPLAAAKAPIFPPEVMAIILAPFSFAFSAAESVSSVLPENEQAINNVPALIQPGQANNSVSLAVGFGHTHAGKVGGSIEKGFNPVGVNAYKFMTASRSNVVSNVNITKGSEKYVLAQTQTHHSIEGRDIVRESTFNEWKKNPKAGNDKGATHVYTIWEKQDYRKDGSPNLTCQRHLDLSDSRLWPAPY
jgi:hypothetical protein